MDIFWHGFFDDPLYQYYFFVVTVFVPMIRIFDRAGMRPWWTMLLAFPYLGFFTCLGVLTLRRWPVLERGGQNA